ncbi:DHA2 family multidrug resistance protein-like MFS transporter [Tamaricihabitans halophyticus]|uniref:DHA2 family multidrug resistance protein-like MFS transporter n=1 Tax=Tamaricihabitans halophyticus TaxID=1262583 RepID=A0A4R2QW50_9PSEU|nr:MFS transporter [Tamaricihabitans halophyticus]TCP53484.1 DHA2 family multidrug resistance protein-like MFS transporter [Tamaricihabitans halophyticus]
MTLAETRATWKEWLGLSAMALALFMMSTDVTVLFIAQPAIAADLEPSAAQALWIVHVGEFLAASLVITMGRLGDLLGRRRLLIIGIAGYGLASLLAAFAPTTTTLIVARAMLGIATATVTPSALALLRSMFPDSRQFSTAFAIVMMAFSSGMVFGPPMGGFLLEHFWWGVVFLINVPFAIYLLAIARWTLPEFRDDQKVSLDPASIALSVLAIMGVVYGLQQSAEGELHVQHVLVAIAGLAAGWLFLRRQRRLASPVLDLAVFTPRQVRVALVALFLVMIALTGPDVLIAPYLQAGLGLSSLETGLLLLIPAVLTIPTKLLAPVLKRFFGLARGAALSLGIAGSGYLAAGFALNLSNTTTLLVVFITGLSMVALAGAAMSLVSELVLTSAPIHRTGTMSALQDVSSGLGSAGGIAVLGTLSAVLYRNSLSTPDELDTAVAATAQESPGAAAELAGDLPSPVRTEFLESISTSLNTGLQAALFAAAGIAGGLVALVLIGLRDTETHHGGQG